MFAIFLTEKAQNFLENKKSVGSTYIFDVKSSGCSGYKYHLHQSHEVKPTHTFSNIDFAIIEENYKFLNNTVIDLVRDGINEKIVFSNPNANHNCGCGESFNIKE